MDRDRHRDLGAGFLSHGILTAPRVYYAMARDGLFFRIVAWLSPRTGAPVVAILVQGAAASLFVFRRKQSEPAETYRAPGHPITTALFVAACAAIFAITVAAYPANSAIGFIILIAGTPVYLYWSRHKA